MESRRRQCLGAGRHRLSRGLQRWTLADIERLARAAHMSRRTFLRRFNDATGTTPAHW